MGKQILRRGKALKIRSAMWVETLALYGKQAGLKMLFSLCIYVCKAMKKEAIAAFAATFYRANIKLGPAAFSARPGVERLYKD